MTDSHIHIASDSKSVVFSVAWTRVSYGSNPSAFIYDHMGPKMISLNDDCD